MTEFEIGFKVRKFSLQDKRVHWDNKMNPDKKNEYDDTVYLQYRGKFYDLFKLYNLVERAESRFHDPVVCSFDIPKEIPIFFEKNILRSHYDVKLLDIRDDFPGMSLQKYFDKKEEFQDKIVPRKFAVVSGFSYGVFSLMSDIRDDRYPNAIETWKNYETICVNYRLPSLTPYLGYR